MSTASAYLTVRGIDVDVVYKDIKNLHIGVYPPVGRVRVAAPDRLDDEQVRLAVIQRLPWIKRQRKQLQDAERQSEREMVTGESHYVWGVGHRLGRRRAPRQAGGRTRRARPADARGAGRHRRRDPAARARGLVPRTQLRDRIPALIARWEPEIGRTVAALADPAHEDQVGLVQSRCRQAVVQRRAGQEAPALPGVHRGPRDGHLLERSHGERFTKLMDDAPAGLASRDVMN